MARRTDFQVPSRRAVARCFLIFPCSEVLSGVATVEVRPMAGSELCELSPVGAETRTERHG